MNKTHKLNREHIDFIRELKGEHTSKTVACMLFDEYGIELTDRAVRYWWSTKHGDSDFYLPEDKLDSPYYNDDSMDAVSMDDMGDKKIISGTINNNIKTVEDLIKYMDVSLDEWDIDKSTIAKADKFIQGEKHQTVTIRVYLKKKSPTVDYQLIKNEILEEVKTIAHKDGEKLAVTTEEDLSVLVLNIFDAHVEKRCFGDERTFEDAEREFMDVVVSIMERASNITKVIFPIGNDFFNADTHLGTTTSGTPQDNLLGWQVAFKRGRMLIARAIDYIKQFAPVEVIVVPGNHDYTKSFYLGDALEMLYVNDSRVQINNSLSPRKYVSWGNNLFCFTHGSEEKPSDLPIIIMREAGEVITEDTYIEVFMGHFHTFLSKENNGVYLTREQSLSPADEWHNKKGYVNNRRGAIGRVYDFDDGPIAIYPYNLKKKKSEY